MSDIVTDECGKRSRLAALRDHIDAAPVILYSSAPALPKGGKLVKKHGSLPADDDAAISLINDLRPENSKTRLTTDDVWIHYLEAGNNNLIDDRWLFLGKNTLKNTAKAGRDGFAFMNSHRTGGLSRPSELPFGRTFAGQYEHYKADDADGKPAEFRRAVLGLYMLRGEYPNGTGGPSTDALHAGIEAGTIFDVSLGYSQDAYMQYICDVCGRDIDDFERDEKGDVVCCRHVPGTHYKMSQEEIDSQLDRGIPHGYATYTLENATPGEVSAVYNGAVPGAGFRKAVTFARAGKFSESELSEVVKAYSRIASPQNFRRSRHDQPGHDDDLAALIQVIVDSKLIPGLTFAKHEDDPPEPTPAPDPTKKGVTVATATETKEPSAREIELAAQIEQLRKDQQARDERDRQERELAKQRETRKVLRKTEDAAHAFARRICGGDPNKDAKFKTEKFATIKRIHFAIGRVDALSPIVEKDADGNDVEYEMLPDFESILLSTASNHAFGEKLAGDGKTPIRLPGRMQALDNLEGDSESDREVADQAEKDALEIASDYNKGARPQVTR